MRTILRSRRTIGAPALRVRRSVAGPLVLLGGCVFLLALVGMLVVGGGVDPRSTEQAPAAADIAPRALPAQSARCQGLESTNARVHGLMQRGELAAAVALASENLHPEPPASCAAAHDELARLWYAADIESLLATSPKDELLGRQAAARWVAIENRADQLGLPGVDRRHPITVARNAYDHGLWQLADAAFRGGWGAGETGVASVEFRHALLRNWGHELAARGNPGGREQALRLLATAHAISKVHGLETDVACTDMRAMGVADCATTAPDPGEPTLRG